MATETAIWRRLQPSVKLLCQLTPAKKAAVIGPLHALWPGMTYLQRIENSLDPLWTAGLAARLRLPVHDRRTLSERAARVAAEVGQFYSSAVMVGGGLAVTASCFVSNPQPYELLVVILGVVLIAAWVYVRTARRELEAIDREAQAAAPIELVLAVVGQSRERTVEIRIGGEEWNAKY